MLACLDRARNEPMVAVLAIMPIFGLIMLGYVLGWRRWLTAENMAGMTTVTFKLFMPAVLFAGIARAPLGEALSPVLLLGYFVPVLAVFALVNLVEHRRRGGASPLGLAAAYSNAVLIGIPLVSTLLGQDKLVYVFSILMFHSLTLFSAHSLYAAFGSGERVSALGLLRNLANPLVIGLLLGAAVNLSGVPLPEPLWHMANWLAQAATPCALIILGMSLSRFRLRPDRQTLVLAAVKLVLFPLAVFCLASLLPLNDDARGVLVMLACCPSGVNVLAFARTPEDTRTVGSTVFLTTVLAALSMPIWLHLVTT
jgi:hypothetical protein